jgi:DNA primase
VPLLDYLIDAKSKLYNLDSGDGIKNFADSVKDLIYDVSNDYDQDRYWSRTAKLAGVTEQRLKTIVDMPWSSNRRRGNRSRVVGPARISSQQASAALESSTGSPLEEHLLSLILQMDDLREFAVTMPAEFFYESDNRALFTAWQSSSTLGELSDELGEDLTEKVHRLAERTLPPSDQARHVKDVTQCVTRLRERHFRRIKELESEQLQQLEGEEAKELLDRSLQPNENLRKVMTGRT